MIRIPSSPQIDAIAMEWADTLTHFLTDPLAGTNRPYIQITKTHRLYFSFRWKKYAYIFNSKCPAGVSRDDRRQVLRKIIAVFSDSANLIGKPVKVNSLTKDCEDLKRNFLPLFDAVKTVYVQIYTDFTTQYAYYFMTKLNIRTCPYCNRHYTFTIEKNAQDEFCTRAEFDHFYDKGKYPLLAVTFYNLVPACHECNHGKGTKSVKVNPYHDEFTSKFVLTDPKTSRKLDVNEILLLKATDDFAVGFDSPTPEEQENIKKLGLVPLFNEHKDYAMEIIEKYTAYDYATQRGLVDTFQGLFHSTAQVDDLIWGQYMHNAANPNRPLSKFTADLLHILKKKGI